jgi:tetratricopeptide (TPR) repeat protein
MRHLDTDNAIAREISAFVTEVKAFGAMDRTDINRVAQNVLVPLFAETYGYTKLENLDIEGGGNFPGIDLADDEARVAIQVTSTSGIEKVKHTLEQFLEPRPEFDPPLAKRYDRLIIYILTEKQKSYSQASLDAVLQGRFAFDASRDIWDFRDLLSSIQGQPLEKKEAILDILRRQVGLTLTRLALPGLIKVPEAMRTAYFVGRRELLERAHMELTAERKTRRIVVFTGMGGIGKTQAALEYIRTYRQSYSRVLWTNAGSEIALLDGLEQLARALLPAAGRAGDAEEVRTALFQWMEEDHNRDWLLVLDGADFRGHWTPARLKTLLPAAWKGKILVTTQYRDFSTFPKAPVLPVDVLSQPDAVGFLLSFAQREDAPDDERAAADRLAELLGRLPLALEQAAAYVRTTGSSFAEYRQLLHRHGLRVLPADFDHAADYQHSVQTVCRLGFDSVRQRSPYAMLLLEMAAFLSADSNCLFPLVMLTQQEQGPLAALVGDRPSKDVVASSIRSLVGTLAKYSLISVDQAFTVARIHSIVQMAAQDAMSADARRDRLDRWSSLFESYMHGQGHASTWSFIEPWFPHALAVARHVVREGFGTEAAAGLLVQVSSFLRSHAHYQTAREFASRAVETRESLAAPSRPESMLALADSLTQLGMAHGDCNARGKAISVTSRALEILESTPGAQDGDIAIALTNLGSFYLEEGDSQTAEAQFRRIVSDSRLHSVLNEARMGLVGIYNQRREYEKAVAMAEEVIQGMLQKPDPDPLRLASAYNNLGVMLAKSGRLAEAQTNYEKALDGYRSILPDSHPHIANLENNLGYLLYRRELYEEALPLLADALPKLVITMGEESPTTRQAAINYRRCLEAIEKRKKAAARAPKR